MEEENNKQAEARRVLEAIRQKNEPIAEEQLQPQKPVNWLVSADKAELQALVEQSRGIKNQLEAKEELSEVEKIVDPISTEQIKVMRQSVAGTEVGKIPLSKNIYEALIRSYFEAVDFLKPSGRAKRCLTDGHQCLHCGQKFAAISVANPDSATSGSSATSGQHNIIQGKPEKPH